MVRLSVIIGFIVGYLMSIFQLNKLYEVEWYIHVRGSWMNNRW
jgi:hypothetical protein